MREFVGEVRHNDQVIGPAVGVIGRDYGPLFSCSGSFDCSRAMWARMAGLRGPFILVAEGFAVGFVLGRTSGGSDGAVRAEFLSDGGPLAGDESWLFQE